MGPALALVGLLAAIAAGSSTTGHRTPSGGSRAAEVAVLIAPHTARSAPSPGASPLAVVSAHRPITGERTVLPVLGHAVGTGGGRWLRVRLPGRPNGHSGWIERAKTKLQLTNWRLLVDLSDRELIVYHAGAIVRVSPAMVGKPATPTPTGDYFVEEDVQLSHGEVGGPFALALSARSNVFQEFDGGPGQIALHGLQQIGGTLGTADSHGCIRLSADTMTWLVMRVGPGTPVTIRN
jgi:hypothetical protein